MNSLENARQLITYIQTSILESLRQCLLIVPLESFDYSPGRKLHTLKYLFYHVISSPYLYLVGIGKKEVTSMEYESITLDVDKISCPKDLIVYYENFLSFLGIMKVKLRLADLQNTIFFNLDSIGFGLYNLTGQKALETAFEEMVHHRGQIYIYLRELNIDPPPLYRHLIM